MAAPKNARFSIEGSGKVEDLALDQDLTVRMILRALGLDTAGGFEMLDPSKKRVLGLNDRPLQKASAGSLFAVSPRMDAGRLAP